MKLSEAIREGAAFHPKGNLLLAQMVDGQLHTCAIGAACVSVILNNPYDYLLQPQDNKEEVAGQIRDRDVTEVPFYSREYGFPELLQNANGFPQVCEALDQFNLFVRPEEREQVNIFWAIGRLNDYTKLTREQIADLLESAGL